MLILGTNTDTDTEFLGWTIGSGRCKWTGGFHCIVHTLHGTTEWDGQNMYVLCLLLYYLYIIQ